MFEKEAHEFQKQIQQEYLYLGKNGAYPPLWERIGELWGKGAEFGYNKANEWHYVKDGDLPKDEKDVQVIYQDCDKVNSYTCLYDIHSESWSYYNLDECLLEPFDYEVIAWKEIVLPELPKEIKEK